jgi:hypothetical protein
MRDSSTTPLISTSKTLNVFENGYELNSDIEASSDHFTGERVLSSPTMGACLTFEGELFMGLVALCNHGNKLFSKESLDRIVDHMNRQGYGLAYEMVDKIMEEYFGFINAGGKIDYWGSTEGINKQLEEKFFSYYNDYLSDHVTHDVMSIVYGDLSEMSQWRRYRGNEIMEYILGVCEKLALRE